MSLTSAGARIGAFDQIVAEQDVFREAVLQSLAERVHFVDAFAGVNALAEQVLIDVRNGPRIDIEAGLPGVERGQAAAGRGMNADADARLENAIALHHDAGGRIDHGLVERVRQRPHQPAAEPRGSWVSESSVIT